MQKKGLTMPKVLLGIIFVCALAVMQSCSKEQPKENPYIEHWKTESIDRQGYSPAITDLEPEPRVLLQASDSWGGSPQKALPKTPVTLKLYDVDVPVALRALAVAAKISVLVSPNVSGKASLNVTNTPWKDAFMSIVSTNGLEYRWQGNILQILTASEKQKEIEMLTLDTQLATQKSLAREAGPLSVAVVKVHYSDAEALKNSLKAMIGESVHNVIEVDAHSNALILQSSKATQTRLLRLIAHLDTPRPQVQLKAYIVETTKEVARELGVKWGGVMRSGNNPAGDNLWAGSAGTGAVGKDPTTGYGKTEGMSGLPLGLDYGSLVGGTGAGAMSFMFGSLSGNMLEAQLNLMEKDGNLNILSSPSITTLDNKMAYTENGEKIPYVSTNDGDTDVKFEDAVLRLEMTPNVIDAKNLKLKVLVKNDEVDTARAVEGNPYIIKKQTETTLIMRSGETVIISGLTKEKGTNSDAGVPLLRELPGGKYLFGSTNKSHAMQEVMIFITPVILPTRTAQDMQARPLPAAPSVVADTKAEE